MKKPWVKTATLGFITSAILVDHHGAADDVQLWRDAILAPAETLELKASVPLKDKTLVWSADGETFEAIDLNRLLSGNPSNTIRVVLPTRRSATKFWIEEVRATSVEKVPKRPRDFERPLQTSDFASQLGIDVKLIRPLSVPYILISSSKKKAVGVNDQVGSEPAIPLIINRFGEIVWWLNPELLKRQWHEFAIFEKTGPAEFALAFQREQSAFYRFDIAGRLLTAINRSEIPDQIDIHHDFLPVPNSDKILFLGNRSKDLAVCSLHAKWQPKGAAACPIELNSSSLNVNGAVIYEFSWQSKAFKKRWDAFDDFDPLDMPSWFHAWGPLDSRESAQYRLESLASRPFQVADDRAHIEWVHANTLEYDSRGQIMILSRNLSSIFWIDPLRYKATRSVGVGRKFDYQYANCDETPFGPHTVSELPDGRLLMFDNDTKRHCPLNEPYPPDDPTGESRVSIYRWDHKAKVVKRDWMFTPKPSIFAYGRGSVRLLRNGNFLAYFSDTRPTGKDILIEIDPKLNQEVGRLEIQRGGPYSGYRAEPIYSIYGPH